MNNYKDIVGLWKEAKLTYKYRGRDSAEAIEVQISKEPEFFLGAFEDHKLVGVVIISCDQRKGWINRLSVHPEHRHKGIAKALIAESEKKLRKRGVKVFCALVEDYNVASKELFNECGYTEHGDIIYFSKRDSDEA